MKMRGKEIAVAGIVATSIWAFAACGDNESTPAEPQSTQSTNAEETSEETVNPDITPEQMTFVDDLLTEPLPQDEATQRIEEAGYVWRLGTIDGEPQAVTMDYRLDRLTLTVDDGLVTDATWG